MLTPRHAMFATIALMLAGVLAQAQDIEIGTRLVCNTQQQVERFVALYNGDSQRTANSVNTALRDPKACAFYSMAYVRGQHLTTAKNRDTTFQIVPLVVLGRVTEDGIDTVQPTHVFSAFEVTKAGNVKASL